MNILLVDDSDYKLQEIKTLLDDIPISKEVRVARSFQGCLRVLEEFVPDVVLMDMTLPTSEDPDGGLDGRDRLFGGRDLIAEIDFSGISTKVIIVSQFDQFDEASIAINLQTLTRRLQAEYPKLLIGSIYYSNVDSAWQKQLRTWIIQHETDRI